MRATVMYGVHDVRVETVPDARIVEPTDAVALVNPILDETAVIAPPCRSRTPSASTCGTNLVG